MSQEEYINKVRELEHQLSMVTSDYVNSKKFIEDYQNRLNQLNN